MKTAADALVVAAGPATYKAPRRPRTTTDGEEVEAHEHNAPRGQTQPPPGARPALLSEVARPQGRLVAPACPCGGVPSLVPVVMVQVAAHDDASLLPALADTVGGAGGEEGGGARGALTGKEQWLMTLVEQLRGRSELPDKLSRLEMAVIGCFIAKREVTEIVLLQLGGVWVSPDECAATTVDTYARVPGLLFENFVCCSHFAGVLASVHGGI